MPRTNNVAEGWHNAFAAMNAVKRPTIFKFIEHVLKDEAIARVKMNSCQKGYPAAPQAPKYRQRNAARKTALKTYLDAMSDKGDDLTDEDSGKEDGATDEATGDPETNEWVRTTDKRKNWLKTPAMQLLKAVADSTRL